ncbi:aldehyde dehydrogenase family protein [Candidatus Uabimicrobium amorphum]|uniref:Aldehyde dehydrogenase n=1 Tax=Uabimicrobium amorphum TaxID=2596890 RepID=A0A5S9F2I3_UABAM|nr:aldehyde dehydrogenase family protein [Candidatus Uabimicrobium amorphum]BBM83707.1 aldehyde dehydrogenase [Candidatus Uabimicrobium amorphum]
MSSISSIFDNLQKNRWRISQTNAQERIEKLKNLRKHILQKRYDIYKALHDDFQKNEVEIELTEIQPTVAEINFCMKRLKKWMKPQRIKTPMMLMGTKSRLRYEARGVVLIISPWNYPFHLAVVPLISAIAAGNCVIVKPSEVTPHTSHLLCELISQVFDKNEVCVVEGDVSICQELLKFPFDHIFFTGSGRVGKHIMRAAAENLSSITLELGGKSPAIVDKTASIKSAAQRIMWGKFLNAGQTCVAPDYVLVHKEVHEMFIAAVKNVWKKFYGESSRPEVGQIVSEKHWERLATMLDEVIADGGKVVLGGQRECNHNYLAPTIVRDVSLTASIMKQEIFGPILPIVTYESLDEVTSFICNNDKPLAVYIFSHSRGNIQRILTNTTSGGTCVNNVAIHLGNPHLPFGGVNASGIGNYHGFHGFKTFSHARSILYQGPFSGLSFIYPPYREWTKKLARCVTNIFS